MAIINRTLDPSQQRTVVEQAFQAIATGVTTIVAAIPWPCVLDAAQFQAFGNSGSPTAQLVVNRFIAGTGATAFALGSANALPTFGVSGVIVLGASLPASGSTLLNLLANDVIHMESGGANSAVKGIVVNLVLRPIQDQKKYFGTLT